MADLMSPIIDIISRLSTCCRRHTRYLCKLQENKILLRTAMEELKEARDHVQRIVHEAEGNPNEPQKRTDLVDAWLQRVQIIEDETEEILQKAHEQLLCRGRCYGSCCRPNNCWSSYKLGKSIATKIVVVDEMKMRTDFQGLTYLLPSASVQNMNLKFMFDMVWKLITRKDDDVVRIMGLYGYGGVGKTTILEKINNEFSNSSTEHGFDDHVVIFVVVSNPINYNAIQKKIGEKLGLSDSLQGDGDESSIAYKIFNMLKEKNFVILLDDIWEKVELQRIGIPSPLTHCNSSKVIFTTRNEQVCELMEATHKFHVEGLPWDKAWSLFQVIVGEEVLTSFPGARELAKDVAKKCDGLPLLLITIGKAMSTMTSLHEWKDVRTTLRASPASEFQGMIEVLSRLKLSHDYLSDETIKSIFLYYVTLPKDHSIDIARLIDIWIVEGFLNRFDNLDEARSHGHHVIETLKTASLFQGGEIKVKKHDIIIPDLALWILNDCKSSSKFLVASNIVCESWRKAERICWTNDEGDGIKNELEEPQVLPNLRTFIVGVKDSFSLPQNFFQLMPYLRVLDFSDSKLTELPTSICQLSELQYLGLMSTKIKELPIELRNLVKLKFLDLHNTFNLRKIPPGVLANLSELQVLNLSGSGFKDWELNKEDGSGLSFCELDKLKQLKDLKITINTSLALENLLWNQKLRMICTCLVLESCINLKSVSLPPSSISKGIGNLTSLKRLAIMHSEELEELTLFLNINDGGETTTTGGTEMLTNNKLEILYLDKLPRLNNIIWGEKYHHYLHVSPFQNLHLIHIAFCSALKDLTWLVYVENLNTLVVEHCWRLETIIELGNDGLEGARGGGGDHQMLNLGGRVFGRLKLLVIRYLPKLKSICSHALAFPSIETIHIRRCPELKKLPLDSGSNVNNTLKEIDSYPKWCDELEWEDETIKSKFLPYFKVYPTQL